jgi:hypothetical protein
VDEIPCSFIADADAGAVEPAPSCCPHPQTEGPQ